MNKDKRYHRITFERPEVAALFAEKAMIRSLVTIDSVDGASVHMHSNRQLENRHTDWITGEVTKYGKTVEWKFNWTEPPRPFVERGQP